MNPVNMLQELTVANKQKLPVYTFETTGSPPEMKFICSVEAQQVKAVGEARNKKTAKNLAAENALTQLGHKMPSGLVKPPSVSTENVKVSPLDSISSLEEFTESRNYIGELNEFASCQGISYPIYEMVLFSESGQFKISCKFQDLETIGDAVTKKKAKQMASYKMLVILRSKNSLSDGLPKPTEDVISAEDNQILSPQLEPHAEPEIED